MTFIFLSPVGLSVEERLVVYVHFLVNGHNQNLVGQIEQNVHSSLKV